MHVYVNVEAFGRSATATEEYWLVRHLPVGTASIQRALRLDWCACKYNRHLVCVGVWVGLPFDGCDVVVYTRCAQTITLNAKGKQIKIKLRHHSVTFTGESRQGMEWFHTYLFYDSFFFIFFSLCEMILQINFLILIDAHTHK